MNTQRQFDWDNQKNLTNQEAHSVSFEQASKAFSDPKHVIIYDEAHSQDENRYFLLGFDGVGVVTVRFTLRNEVIRIFGAGYWRKGKKIYEENKK